MSLAVSKIYGLCPGGDLGGALACRLANGEFSPAYFQGICGQARLQELNTLLPGSSMRRVPRLARLALRTALEVCPETVSNHALVLNTRCGSVGSTFEFLDSLLNDGPSMASPTAFSHSVTNMAAAYLSQGLNLTGPILTLTQPSFSPALEAADILLHSGLTDTVLLGFVAEHSDTMKSIETATDQPLSVFTDGAVFFQLRPPGHSDDELIIDWPNQPEEGHGYADDATGPVPFLPLALRLALAGLEMGAEKSPAARYLIRDDGLGILSIGGNGTQI